MPLHFVANKALLVNREGKILMLRRAKDARWDLVGGRMEQHEDPREALLREMREECGRECSLTNAQPFHIGRWLKDKDETQPIIGLFWHIPVDHFEPILSEEHDDFAWVDIESEIAQSIEPFFQGYIASYRNHCL